MTVKILIVDDEVALLSAISDYLTARGYVCECATEAPEAIALLGHVPFDVVVTDVYLSHVPQADGFEVVSFIRERSLPVRVIVMSAHDTPQVTAEASRLCTDLFLRKPIPLSRLADAVGSFSGGPN